MCTLRYDNEDIDVLVKEIKKRAIRKNSPESVRFAVKTIKALRALELKY